MKFLFILAITLCLFTMSYAQQVPQLKMPQLIYKHAKSRHKQLKIEILNKLVNPLLKESKYPIEEIVIDLCPEILGYRKGKRGCDNEAQGKLTISITVNGFPVKQGDGFSNVVWLERNKDGSFDKDEYLKLLPHQKLVKDM